MVEIFTVAVPPSETLRLMAAAGFGVAALVMLDGIGVRWRKIRVWFQQNREGYADLDDINALGDYQPGALSAEGLRTQPIRALMLGIIAATAVWGWFESEFARGALFIALAALAGAILSLLHKLSRSHADLDPWAVTRGLGYQPPSFMELYGRQLWEVVGTALLVAGCWWFVTNIA